MANVLTSLSDYQYWHDKKLANTQTKLENCILEIRRPFALSDTEKNKIKSLCRHNNFALFNIQPQENYPHAIVAMNQQLGLVDFDQHLYAQDQGLAYITQSNQAQQAEFIPYTNKSLGWHTDGYYNPIEQRIRAFSLFCITPANTGGENQWIDPQMLYLLLREDNPDIAKALTHPKAMTIPEHRVGNKVRRQISVGAIFFIDEATGALSMRYTQRKKYVDFLDSVEIKQALEQLDNILNTSTDYHFEQLMHTGQGLICNNVLHKRNGFIDAENRPRLLLRGRYFNQLK